MTNPVLVEVTRGATVESRHRGAIVVADVRGKPLLALGDVEAPVYPRSAVKAIQALPLVESGAADAFGFRSRELALAQASHGGEPQHVAGVSAMLAAIGLGEPALECGAHSPSNHQAAAELLKAGKTPTQLHNNCSGKHAGFLAVCRHRGIPHRGYVTAAHPVQREIRDALHGVTGARHDAEACATDGCSIPTYAVPLSALAHGFARFGTGVGLSRERAAAARRIYEAAISEPFHVAGSGRICTDTMALLRGAALVKTGAEGVFCAALAGLGLGLALKCDDGAVRAAEAMMAAALAWLLPEHADDLKRWSNPPVLTRRGARAGEIRLVPDAFPRKRQ
jgi:L-asparaginase II